MKINVTKAFAFAHDGIRVVRYEKGEQELSDDAAEFAVKNECGKVVISADEKKSKAPTENK